MGRLTRMRNEKYVIVFTLDVNIVQSNVLMYWSALETRPLPYIVRFEGPASHMRAFPFVSEKRYARALTSMSSSWHYGVRCPYSRME
jgi:hypothetical protein